MAHRGRRIEPTKECEFCNQELPRIRHPNMRYCNTTCRQRAKWTIKNEGEGVRCEECGKYYKRVGSHVVQVHGYGDVSEYRQEFGLMVRETRTDKHAEEMRGKASTIDNLEKGRPTRYRKGGDHGERVREFWKNRKSKKQP